MFLSHPFRKLNKNRKAKPDGLSHASLSGTLIMREGLQIVHLALKPPLIHAAYRAASGRIFAGEHESALAALPLDILVRGELFAALHAFHKFEVAGFMLNLD